MPFFVSPYVPKTSQTNRVSVCQFKDVRVFRCLLYFFPSKDTFAGMVRMEVFRYLLFVTPTNVASTNSESASLRSVVLDRDGCSRYANKGRRRGLQ